MRWWEGRGKDELGRPRMHALGPGVSASWGMETGLVIEHDSPPARDAITNPHARSMHAPRDTRFDRLSGVLKSGREAVPTELSDLHSDIHD